MAKGRGKSKGGRGEGRGPKHCPGGGVGTAGRHGGDGIGPRVRGGEVRLELAWITSLFWSTSM
eukprot:364161-Chlamydomonas_euryale.AAC.4